MKERKLSGTGGIPLYRILQLTLLFLMSVLSWTVQVDVVLAQRLQLGEGCTSMDQCGDGECRSLLWAGGNWCVHCGAPGEIVCIKPGYAPCDRNYSPVGGYCVRTDPVGSRAASCGFAGQRACPPSIGAPCRSGVMLDPLGSGICVSCGEHMYRCCVDVGNHLYCNHDTARCVNGICRRRDSWRDSILNGLPFNVVLNPTSNNMGTLQGGQTYSVVYRNGAFTCTGYNIAAGKVTTHTYSNADPAQWRISLWGRVFNYNEKGEVFDPQYGLAGKLSN